MVQFRVRPKKTDEGSTVIQRKYEKGTKYPKSDKKMPYKWEDIMFMADEQEARRIVETWNKKWKKMAEKRQNATQKSDTTPKTCVQPATG